MHILLLIAYSFLLSLAVVRIPFIKKSNIRPVYLLVFFWLRCIAAWVHNAIAWRYYPNHGDIWDFFETGKWMKTQLLQGQLWQQFYQGSRHLQLNDAIRGEISFRTLSALNMVLDFLSFDNFYINTLLFSFLVFMGSIALYRVFKQAFANHHLCALAALLLPGTLFFTACIHKEGLIYLLLGFFLLCWQRQLKKGFTITGSITCLVVFVAMVVLRSNLLLGLVPGVFMWTMTEKTTLGNKLNLLITLGLVAAAIMAAASISQHYNLFTIIINRQHEFDDLQGKSRLFLPLLQPGFRSFLSTLPYAIVNGFFEPLPGNAGQPVYIIFSIEVLLIWIMVLIAIYHILRRNPNLSPPAPGFGWFCTLLAISQLLLIGYVIPFAGAIVRYRSLYLPFLLAPAIYCLRSTAVYMNIENRLRGLLDLSN